MAHRPRAGAGGREGGPIVLEEVFPTEVCVNGGDVGMGPFKRRGTRKSVIIGPQTGAEVWKWPLPGTATAEGLPV